MNYILYEEIRTQTLTFKLGYQYNNKISLVLFRKRKPPHSTKIPKPKQINSDPDTSSFFSLHFHSVTTFSLILWNATDLVFNISFKAINFTLM